MFPQEYINFGKVTHTNCGVSVYEDNWHCKNLPNLPGGTVRTAYWQGNNVHVEMEDGWHYLYEGFGNYSSKWR